ncbi:MAG: hypothetical protein CL611_02060 [Anaerolineaceae bacterium]|nr:hypothetical protein [Anaerolineaceae bacterium]
MKSNHLYPSMSARGSPGATRAAVLAIGLTLSLAALLRFVDFASLPAGLYYDEAVEGLDALEIIRGARPIYFAGENSRAALFTYAVAHSISILGRTPAAIRLPAILAGCGTVLGVYLVAQSLFSRRIGLLAAFTGAFSVWMILLGRLGDNPAMSALLLSFGLWLGVRGWQSRRWWCWTLSGLLIGLALYTYEAARVVPLIFPLWALLLAVGGAARRLWPGTLFFVAAFLLAATPLLLYASGNWTVVIERSEDVAVFNAGDDFKTLMTTAGKQTLIVLRMFVMKSRGDWNWRQNIAGRPVFDLLMAVPFLISLGLSLHRRWRTKMLLLSLWVGAGLLVTIFSESAPHFRRASTILPVLFIWPAIGIDWMYRRLTTLVQPVLALLVVGAMMLGSAFITTRDFWLERHLARPQIATSFDHPITVVATAVNRFLNVGWQDRGVLAGSSRPAPKRQTWMEASVWSENPAVRFLVPLVPNATPALRLLQPAAPLPPAAINEELLLVLHKDAPIPPLPDNYLIIVPVRESDLIAMIPDGAVATMENFPGVEVGSAPDIVLPYRLIGARVMPSINPLPAATLGESLTLLGATVTRAGETLNISALWQVDALLPPPISISAHLFGPAGKFLGGDDGLDITPELWRPGLRFAQRHTLHLPPNAAPGDYRVSLGLYRLDNGTRYTMPDGRDEVQVGVVTTD